MSKKSKRKKNKALPNSDQHGTQQNLPPSNIHIRGEIEVGRSPNLTDEHNTERREDTTHERKKYLVEKLTLIAVIIYAGVAVWQACLTRTAIFDARKQFVADQRPYVWLSFLDPSPARNPVPIQVNHKLEADLHFVNYGKSPALKMAMNGHIFHGSNAQALAYAWLDEMEKKPLGELSRISDKSVSVIPPVIPSDPRRSPDYTTLESDKELTEDEFEFIKGNDFSFFVVSFLEYKDLSGNIYQTEICASHLKTGAMLNCNVHNGIR